MPGGAHFLVDDQPWPDPASAQQMHLDVRVEDLDAAEQEVLQRGARLLSRVGASYRIFADPAGHPFCLVRG